MRLSIAIAIILFATVTGSAQYSKKTVVAHRGASAYAPEHTLNSSHGYQSRMPSSA